MIGTVMPSPPPLPVPSQTLPDYAAFNARQTAAIHAEANRMLQRALESGQRPKWFTVPSIPVRPSVLYSGDDFLEACLHLAALSALPPSTSQKELQTWISHERPKWEEAYSNDA
jgi:hypothetical protein